MEGFRVNEDGEKRRKNVVKVQEMGGGKRENRGGENEREDRERGKEKLRWIL